MFSWNLKIFNYFLPYKKMNFHLYLQRFIHNLFLMKIFHYSIISLILRLWIVKKLKSENSFFDNFLIIKTSFYNMDKYIKFKLKNDEII